VGLGLGGLDEGCVELEEEVALSKEARLLAEVDYLWEAESWKQARLLEAEDWLLLEATPTAAETVEVHRSETVKEEALPMEVEMGSCLAKEEEGEKTELNLTDMASPRVWHR